MHRMDEAAARDRQAILLLDESGDLAVRQAELFVENDGERDGLRTQVGRPRHRVHQTFGAHAGLGRDARTRDTVRCGPENARTTTRGTGNSSWYCVATPVCLLKSPFLLWPLMLRPTMDTLLGNDVGACLASPDPPNMGAFAGCAPA